jgi:hypothetical protein
MVAFVKALAWPTSACLRRRNDQHAVPDNTRQFVPSERSDGAGTQLANGDRDHPPRQLPHAAHTTATLMLVGGADLRSIQTLLGHESLNTTQIYTHVTIKRLREVHKRTQPTHADSKPTRSCRSILQATLSRCKTRSENACTAMAAQPRFQSTRWCDV